MALRVVRTQFAEKVQYWGRQCNVCGQNYSVVEKFDWAIFENGTKKKRRSWQASLCKCRYVCQYRNGEFVYHDKDHPLFKKYDAANRQRYAALKAFKEKSETPYAGDGPEPQHVD